MKNLKSIISLEARNLKYFFKSETAQLYLLEIVLGTILLGLVVLLAAFLG